LTSRLAVAAGTGDLAGVEEHLVGGHAAQRAQRQQREVAAGRPADAPHGGQRAERERRDAQPQDGQVGPAQGAHRLADGGEGGGPQHDRGRQGRRGRHPLHTGHRADDGAPTSSRPFTNPHGERKLSFAMLDVRRLHMLRELSERGTIAATAGALGYSAPAVSQHLAALERQVGVALLERQGRRVVLTPAARLLVGRTERVLAELEAAEAELATGSGEVRGSVRLAAFPTAAATLVPRAMATFAARHPHAEVLLAELEPRMRCPP
jgi:DNA-binding transcriptional ArsR family regulator